MALRIHSISVLPLAVPLRDPFVIATARVDVTPSVLVRVDATLDGKRVVGLGEGACLPPVTRETPAEVVATLTALGPRFIDSELRAPTRFADWLGPVLDAAPVARAALQVAVLDAWCRAVGQPLVRLLAPDCLLPVEVVSDMTLPILPTARMVELARHWRQRGFVDFKVKVGKDIDADLRALTAVAAAVPDARFRLDANEGFTPATAVALARECQRRALTLTCFEQPCPRDLAGGLAEVQAQLPEVPIIADESCRTMADLGELLNAPRPVGGVNLKLVKHGGLLEALAIGQRAAAAGLRVMVGGMVETRLGMSAAAALAAVFPGVLADLDTAWLLTDDPFVGGYQADGARYRIGLDVGHGVTVRPLHSPCADNAELGHSATEQP
jgi:L-alanine-DL-glutamate epimerase-like enolase superfamily enzyme